MPKTALLIVSKPNVALSILSRIKNCIQSTLYILLLSEPKLVGNESSNERYNASQRFPPPSKHCSSVVRIYTETLNSKYDVRVLLIGLRGLFQTGIYTRNNVDTIYVERELNCDDLKTSLTTLVKNKSPIYEIVSFSEEEVEENDNRTNASSYVCSQPEMMVEEVVLGGTFDRLHTGHKILLTEAVLHCDRKITVGVTDSTMIKSKKLWELIEPCKVRMQKVKEFLQEIEPRLEYSVVPINDVYGPTKNVPEFEMLIVSAETLKGGDKVNELRSVNGLKPLTIHSVPLFLEEMKLNENEEDKISSSNGRIRLLGTLLRPPVEKPHLPVTPYVIGLSGGIASGKSSVSEELAKCGATVINADTMAHKVYRVGTSCYEAVIKHFGQNVVAADGQINRKELGAIVFSDKTQLEKLNSLVWPSLWDEIKEEIANLGNTGVKVVVVEAAVLLQAEWYKECHEVWTTILPAEEAAERLQKRNNLTKEEAEKRLAAQPNNEQQLTISNVVFSTLWSKAQTEKQVRKAWAGLQERLLQNNSDKSNL